MHLFRTTPLVSLLARQEVGGTDQARYLLASFLVFTIPAYAGLMPSSGAGYTWAIGFEGWFYVAIAFFGVRAACDAAGGAINKNFITEFICMYVPVAITTLLAVWGVYWLVIWQLSEQLAEWSWSHSQFAQNLRVMGTDFFGLLTFASHVIANSTIYLRLIRLLGDVQAEK
jgi:hypothetical protein